MSELDRLSSRIVNDIIKSAVEGVAGVFVPFLLGLLLTASFCVREKARSRFGEHARQAQLIGA